MTSDGCLPFLRQALREQLPGKKNAYLRMALRNAAENAARSFNREADRYRKGFDPAESIAHDMAHMHSDRPELTPAVLEVLKAAIGRHSAAIMTPRPKPKERPKDEPPAEWARRAVDAMTDEERKRFAAQHGLQVSVRDTRPPFIRMIDEACGYKPGAE